MPEQPKYFDCNAMIGPRPELNSGTYLEASKLLEEMEYCGIDKALVYHSLARYYSPLEGNKVLIEEIKNFPKLLPVWIVLPHHLGDFPAPEELISLMEKNGVKAVRLFPHHTEYNLSLSDWMMKDLWTTLEQYNIPLFLDFGSLQPFTDNTPWDNLVELLSNYPNLPVILTNISYRSSRYLNALMPKYRNLYIELSGYNVHRGIELLFEKIGAERMLFGSRMPFFSPGGSITMIAYSLIPEAAQNKLKTENIERLLNQVKF